MDVFGLIESGKEKFVLAAEGSKDGYRWTGDYNADQIQRDFGLDGRIGYATFVGIFTVLK